MMHMTYALSDQLFCIVVFMFGIGIMAACTP